ncbi:MAG: asparagine synthase-related protein, partial [Nitrososphaera sp.]|nr:asparagine synthase-related protein [Nitrososphaera sp.]
PLTETQIHLVTASWHTEGGISVKGSAYLDGLLLGAKDLCVAAQPISSENEFASFLEKLNGFYSIIIENEEQIFAAVDVIRSIPLFYSVEKGVLYLSDTAETLQQYLGADDASELVRLEFMLTGYVTGSDTLALGIRQLQSGEYLAFQNTEKWHAQRYFSFASALSLPNDKAVLWKELDRVSIAAVERLAHWAGGRTIVIPLSGGYDSRLLAVLLKQIGYDSVLTYTYGRSKSAEVKMAKEVARSLGLECNFVEYTHEAWWQWFHSSEREAYFRAAHNLASIPHIQDWPAVWSLKQNNLLPPDAVIAPGHSGDFVAGSHIPRRFCELTEFTKDDFVSEVFDHHYTLWRSPTFDPRLLDALRERIAAVSEFHSPAGCSFEYATGKYEAWDWRERQAKFIVNAVRVYDFWGYDWWLPYFDVEVASYWLRVPYDWRIGCRLYKEYAIDRYARVANLSRTDASRREPKSRVERLTVATAPYLAARYLFHLVATDRMRRRKRPENSYDRHPLAIYGIMDRMTFNKYSNEFRNFHSFISKAMLEGDFF